MSRLSTTSWRSLLLRAFVVAATYILAARLGLLLDAVAGFAALVWAPSGIALAALLVFGVELWPGIALGAFIVNTWVGAPPLVAIGIAAGNTLEAVAATSLLRRVPGFQARLERVVDALALIGLAGALSTLISAGIGVASLMAGGVIPATDAASAFRAWWMGDFMGMVLATPLLLAWHANHEITRSPWRWLEVAGVALAIALVAFSTLLRSPPLVPGLIMPVLIWPAIRFGPRGAATASLSVAVIAIWATAAGIGPFVRPQLHDSLFAVQVFLAVIASTFLVLSAIVAERRRAERHARRAQREAAEANAAKADFLAVMSHELRTPLNAISGYVDLLLAGVQGPLTDKQHQSLERVQHSGRHLLTLIDDVLTFSKQEAGRLEIHPDIVAVNDVIEAAELLVQPDLEKKGITLVRLPSRDASVVADPEKVRQIVVNLLSNAAKYTGEGGEVRIGTEQHGSHVRVWVSDTGVGIPAEQVPRVFEPFFQVERGNTRRYHGIGLGLTIARDLARAMGGDVSIESKVNAGTTASLVLPAASRFTQVPRPTPVGLPEAVEQDPV
ncbi:MAG TPA: MASE1 domain-containing protein [Gemmatimonadaceae bacterium]|nr:MASE1 domain-containing protein [Gemmatimonadaceae bacterium]